MAIEDGPAFETRKQNVLEALQAAREDWIAAEIRLNLRSTRQP